MSIRILLCDDHALMRSGIISLLKDEPDIFIVGEAADGNELIKQYELLLPDLVITDISMPGLSGTNAVKELKVKYPDIKVLFLSAFNTGQYIYLVLKVGGLGLIGKEITKGELLFAIKEVQCGKKYFGVLYDDKKISEIIERYDHKPITIEIDSNVKLTETEEKILIFINEGLSTVQMAEKLFLSKRTVDSQRIKIMKKFGLKSTLALLKFAIIFTGSRKDKG
jgi:two-component system response regulator NreC